MAEIQPDSMDVPKTPTELPESTEVAEAPADSPDSTDVATPRELPEFNLKNVLGDIYSGINNLLFNPEFNKVVVPVLIPVTSLICKWVIANVKYTEIDFSTYMQQIELVNAGALDYSIIHGDTGPIVYPAGFVQVYQVLYWITNGGADLGIAQTIFGYIFTLTVLMTCVVYTMVDGIPPWTLYLLIASRRLISIYVLRMFNDCFTTLGMISVVLLLQQASYWSASMSDFHITLLCGVAADVYSMAILVKMNALLYLPAFALVVYFLVGERFFRLLAVLLVIPVVQVLIGWRFLLPLFWDDEARRLRWAYLSNAFDFSRKFKYEWTVNWKFILETLFLSNEFGYMLLALHVGLLLIFGFTRFLAPQVTGKTFLQLLRDAIKPCTKTVSKNNRIVNHKSGPRLVLLIFATTNIIGVLCARTLHYQFLSWYCWLLPFLLFASGSKPILAVCMFFFHEWCWNVFPATQQTSQILVMVLAVTTMGVWTNKEVWFSETYNEE